MATLNANPIIYAGGQEDKEKQDIDSLLESLASRSPSVRDPWDASEVFDLIRHVNDPEHPLTLEQLNVAQLKLVNVDDEKSRILIHFTPTIPHCSMATLIGLSLRVKLIRCLPSRFKVDLRITPGTHSSEQAINKQLNDKERVAAALENNSLLDVVAKCIDHTDKPINW